MLSSFSSFGWQTTAMEPDDSYRAIAERVPAASLPSVTVRAGGLADINGTNLTSMQ